MAVEKVEARAVLMWQPKRGQWVMTGSSVTWHVVGLRADDEGAVGGRYGAQLTWGHPVSSPARCPARCRRIGHCCCCRIRHSWPSSRLLTLVMWQSPATGFVVSEWGDGDWGGLLTLRRCDVANGMARMAAERTGGGGKQEADVATDNCSYPDLGCHGPWDRQMVT